MYSVVELSIGNRFVPNLLLISGKLVSNQPDRVAF